MINPGYLQLARQGASLGNAAFGGAGNSPLGLFASGLGVYRGLTSGTPTGEAGAAIGAGRLANRLGAFGDSSGAVGSALGGAAGALNLYGGIKQGGVAGDTQAALGAAQAAAPIAAAAGSSLAPALAAAGPISLALAPALIGMSTPAYSMPAKFYQSLSDTLSKGPGVGQQASYSGDSPEGQQYGNYVSRLLGAMTTGDPEEQAILRAHGISAADIAAAQHPATLDMPYSSGWASGLNKRTPRNARGGKIRGIKMKSGGNVRSKLRRLYEGSFANRVKHFDGGGYNSSPGVDYSPYVSAPSTPTPAFNLGDTSQSGVLPYAGDNTGAPSFIPAYDPAQAAADTAYQNAGGGSGGGGAGDSSGGGALSALGSALGVSNMGQFIQKYGALAPLLAAAFGGNKQASAPGTPAGYGPIPRIATPNMTRSYTQPNVANWYTYGQGPEQSFFSNNQLPYVPGVSPASAAPGGGAASGAAPTSAPGMMNTQPIAPGGGRMAQGGAFDSTQGDTYVPDPGHGDGTSDGIDAKLSGGEYVMDAGTVSTLGNGSNEAGARALDNLRARVRKHAGKQLVKGKQFMKAKPPESYLKRGAK